MDNLGYCFPDYFPEGCPPAEATSENIVLYRLCKGLLPAEGDFLSFFEKNPDKYKGNVLAYGLSVFPNAEDCQKAKDKSPRLRKECSGIAFGQVTEDKGKILRTPNKSNPTHITWWMYKDVKPLSFFEEYNGEGVKHE